MENQEACSSENQEVQDKKPWFCNSNTLTLAVLHALSTCPPCNAFYKHINDSKDFISYCNTEDGLHDEICQQKYLEVDRHAESLREMAIERAALEKKCEAVMAELARVQMEGKAVIEHIRILQSWVISTPLSPSHLTPAMQSHTGTTDAPLLSDTNHGLHTCASRWCPSFSHISKSALSLYCHVNNVNTYRDGGSLHLHIWTCMVWATWQRPGKVSQGQKGIVRN